MQITKKKVKFLKQIWNQTMNHYEKKGRKNKRRKERIYLITRVNQKKAQNMLPCVAVQLGEAEWNRSIWRKRTSWKFLLIIGLEIWQVPYATVKIFLNIVWSRLEPKDPTITDAGRSSVKQARLLDLQARLLDLLFLTKFCQTKWRNNLWTGTKTLFAT